MTLLLSVEGVSVELPTPHGVLCAVDGVNLALAPGRTLGIVGESGCGKTMLARAILQLLPKRARLGGRVVFEGWDLAQLTPSALRRLRGPALSVVFQDPMSSLNPVLTLGTQLAEGLREHLGMSAAAATARSIELLAAVGIPAPEQRLRQYPHQLSGGMRQRVAIAIALSCEPRLLIADEPTTALDVTVQTQILDLLAREQRRRHMAMILITHDLGIVAGRTDEAAVMYAGRVVEYAPTRDLFSSMRMPYTLALLSAIPTLDSPPHTRLRAITGRLPDPTRPLPGCSFASRCSRAERACRDSKPPLAGSGSHLFACFCPLRDNPSSYIPRIAESLIAPSPFGTGPRGRAMPLLDIADLVVEYTVGGRTVHAVSGVSLQIARGETLGLVGESGCGKSTLGRAVLQLRPPTSGRITFDGLELTTLGATTMRKMRKRLQLIFQDPISSLNARRRIGDIVAEPLVIAGMTDRRARVRKALTAVGLEPDLVIRRLPHELSGGQCQRICLARALILEPELVVCDEPVSALDVSIRAQILNLLEDMKARYGLTLLFIAHDLAVVKAVSDRVAVMYLGRICEIGPSETLFAVPAHPYTRLLLDAIPVPDPTVRPMENVPVGEPPSPIAPPSGCRYRTRCPRADARCAADIPILREIAPAHFVACHHDLTQPVRA
ncbi:MAG: dipeptide ABC transporter ATP-binding protein [Rhodopila sp.]